MMPQKQWSNTVSLYRGVEEVLIVYNSPEDLKQYWKVQWYACIFSWNKIIFKSDFRTESFSEGLTKHHLPWSDRREKFKCQSTVVL